MLRWWGSDTRQSVVPGPRSPRYPPLCGSHDKKQERVLSATCVLKFCAFNACLFVELGCSLIDVELEIRCSKICLVFSLFLFSFDLLGRFICNFFIWHFFRSGYLF